MEKLSLGDGLRSHLWKELPNLSSFDLDSLNETLLGGQSFRWWFHPDFRAWSGVVREQIFHLHLSRNNKLFVYSPTGTTQAEIISYLGTGNLLKTVDALPWRSDPVLERLKSRWASLSILNQPPGETLLAFLLSSNKQILQIRDMLEKLATRFGKPIRNSGFHALPTWETLAGVDEAELRNCSLGYRARHVANTATFLKNNPDHLSLVANSDYTAAREELIRLPGVGAKVADCVLLFGFNRMEAFPVDTWIERILINEYKLSGWSRVQLAEFARIHFGKGAGLAQQWFFAEARISKASTLTNRATTPHPASLPDLP